MNTKKLMREIGILLIITILVNLLTATSAGFSGRRPATSMSRVVILGNRAPLELPGPSGPTDPLGISVNAAPPRRTSQGGPPGPPGQPSLGQK